MRCVTTIVTPNIWHPRSVCSPSSWIRGCTIRIDSCGLEQSKQSFLLRAFGFGASLRRLGPRLHLFQLPLDILQFFENLVFQFHRVGNLRFRSGLLQAS